MAELALSLVAATIGAMLFFGAVVAPTAFRTLGEQIAGPFVRALFPKYYLVFSVTTATAAVAAFLARAPVSGLALLLVAGGFIYAFTLLMPSISRARDAGSTADFERLHRRSVRLNLLQLAAMIGALAGIAAGS
ncbi:MAG: hypothetical protein AMJ59_00155 [Gammaproteobacteria bacterium SG8_31]|jgi:hypothetical protein|nr:MAG: hypothetical protein AMJ59_00155 [Gammaproteobacteria bacterium SG8_31]